MQITLDQNISDVNFEKYHKENPQIYKAFCEKTFEAISKGFKHLGSKAIFEQIRWDTGVSANGETFKVNNKYTPHYARLFESEHPQYRGFFRRRFSKANVVNYQNL